MTLTTERSIVALRAVSAPLNACTFSATRCLARNLDIGSQPSRPPRSDNEMGKPRYTVTTSRLVLFGITDGVHVEGSPQSLRTVIETKPLTSVDPVSMSPYVMILITMC